MKIKRFAYLLAALSCMGAFGASNASASMYVKNNSNKVIYYQHVYHHSCANGCDIYDGLSDGWRQHGWWKLEPGQKVKVKSGDERRWFYWYAFQVNGGVYGSASNVWDVPNQKHDNCTSVCVGCIVGGGGSCFPKKGHRSVWKSADNFTLNLN